MRKKVKDNVSALIEYLPPPYLLEFFDKRNKLPFDKNICNVKNITQKYITGVEEGKEARKRILEELKNK